MLTDDFDYPLPEDAIAQTPVEPRDAARLLVDRGPGTSPDDLVVADLPNLLRPGDVLAVNTTRVLPARLRLRKPTGGAVEVFLLEALEPLELSGGVGPDRADSAPSSLKWEALVRPSRKIRPGTVLEVGPDLSVEVGGSASDVGTRLVTLHLPTGEDLPTVLQRYGVVPLPPYISRPLADPERYQTVFSDRPESVAAPTAGLHLTDGVLERCRERGVHLVEVELAVGLGTFRPMMTAHVEDHDMHAERYRVSPSAWEACQAASSGGSRVIAVGTTTTRALESVARTGRLEAHTDLFIRRPFDWQVVDGLLTNFHLPRSSLLVLVDAFIGHHWRDLYDHALDQGYRFLSFGDAMFLTRGAQGDLGGADGEGQER